MKKVRGAIFFVCLVLLLGYGYDKVPAKELKCKVTITADNPYLDLTGIMIDVYCANCTYRSLDGDTCVYSESFYESMESDSNGIILFSRPSDCFSITIDKKSLPDGYGISLDTFFFDVNTNDFDIGIFKIDKVDVETDFFNHNMNDWEQDSVISYDCDGNILITDARIISKSIELLNESCIINEQERDICLRYDYIISVAGKEYAISKSNIEHCPSIIEKSYILNEIGKISTHKYMCEIAKYIIYGDEYKDTDYSIPCGNELLNRLVEYRNSSNNIKEDYSLIDLAISSYNKNNKSTSCVYSSNGYFCVEYDNNGGINSSIASAVANEFETIDSYFCSSIGYTRPFNPLTSTFRIVITNALPAGIDGRCWVNSGYPFVELSYDTATYIANTMGSSTPFTNRFNGVAAHEYFHAIMYAYGIPASETWMQECFASWAGMDYESDNEAYQSGNIHNFLLTPTQSLFTVNSTTLRHYGSCLFPLYINKTNGTYAIKKILENYSTSTGALNAINNGLSYYGYSLSDKFQGCAVWNYDTEYYYYYNPTVSGTSYQWGDVVNTQVTLTSYPFSSSVTLPSLSSKYFVFNSSTMPKTLTVTVDFTNSYGTPLAGIKALRIDNSGIYHSENYTISSGRCTIVKSNFGNNNAKKMVVIPMNVSSSSGALTVSTSAVIS